MGYTPFDNDADRLTHQPERVHEHQWRSLVYYWGTRKAQKKSTKNKEIRKKTLNHITDRKPFSVVRVEETNKNGVPTTRLEVWMAGYSKDNKPSTDKVAEVMHVGWWSPKIIRGDDREAIHIPNHKFTMNVVRNLSQKT